MIRAAWPGTVVRDSEDFTALYFPVGTCFKRTEVRLPLWPWSLVDDVWTSDVLVLTAPGEAHSVLLFWEGPKRVFDRWYINLQAPFTRTLQGFDFVDHFLDIVVRADLSGWEWKDEDELQEAVTLGLVTPAQAQEIQVEGERVISQIESRAFPFGDGWDIWRPNSSWPVPELPAGWDRV
ncbi:MAG: YgaC family protein [Chloroflexi bacterium]|nr:YgaC family protein [Chloroflexota bacterium]